MSKKKKPAKFVWRELTNEEALKKFGASFTIIGSRSPLQRKPPQRKTQKEAQENAGSALTLQFEDEASSGKDSTKERP